MMTAALAFAAAFGVAAVLTPLIRDLAIAWGVVDHALTSRKIHGRPVPRLGGIAIAVAFYVPILGLLLVDSALGARFYAHPVKAFGLLAGGLVIAVLGVFDDLKGASPRLKFAIQFAVAGLMYGVGFRIDHIVTPFGAALDLGVFAIPFTLLWIAGVVNALNLIDGLDGLAGGVAFIALGTILIVAIGRMDAVMMLITAALAGAVLGFLFYNFNPASIFMGDTGSMFLGFVLATTAIGSNERSTSTISMLVPILALGFPIADTLLAMTRRAVRGVPMFSGDREHIHHRLLDLGLSQRKAVLVLYAVSIVLGLGAIGIAYSSSSQTLFFLLALAGMAYLALRHLGYVRVKDAARVLEDRRKNRELRGSIRHVTNDLRSATSLDDVWSALQDASRALGASAIALELPGPRSANDGPFSAGFDDDHALFRVRYSLLVERPGDRNLELGWDDGRSGVDRDTEIAIELLCDHLSITLQRLDRAAVEPVPGMVVNLRR